MSVDIKQFAHVLVDVADTLVADFDLIEFLHSVARHAVEVSGGAAAGVLLSDADGSLHHVGASGEDARLLELLQVQNDEGPCLDSYRTGEPVVVPDLALARDRWPSFAPRATGMGVVSVHAIPMRLRHEVIGGLNIFQTSRHEIRPEDVSLLQALADMATIALIQERAVSRAELLTEQLQVALTSRIVVEQAKGAVARRFGISVDEAFERLRRHARRTRRRLTDVAHEVVTSTSGPDLLRGD
jgi:GAF domain-containing protein